MSDVYLGWRLRELAVLLAPLSCVLAAAKLAWATTTGQCLAAAAALATNVT